MPSRYGTISVHAGDMLTFFAAYRWKIGELEEVERMKEEGDSDVEEIAAESPKRAIEAGRKTLFKYFWTWRIV